MGTEIEIKFTKGEETPKATWDELGDKVMQNYDDPTFDNDFINSGVIYCSYSTADLNSQLEYFGIDLKNSDIEVDLYYLERNPNESLYFEVEK